MIVLNTLLPLVGPPCPSRLLPKFSAQKEDELWSFQSIPLLINSINLKRDGVRICLGKDVGRWSIEGFLTPPSFRYRVNYIGNLKSNIPRSSGVGGVATEERCGKVKYWRLSYSAIVSIPCQLHWVIEVKYHGVAEWRGVATDWWMLPGWCCIAIAALELGNGDSWYHMCAFRFHFWDRKVNWNQASHVRASSVHPQYRGLIVQWEWPAIVVPWQWGCDHLHVRLRLANCRANINHVRLVPLGSRCRATPKRRKPRRSMAPRKHQAHPGAVPSPHHTPMANPGQVDPLTGWQGNCVHSFPEEIHSPSDVETVRTRRPFISPKMITPQGTWNTETKSHHTRWSPPHPSKANAWCPHRYPDSSRHRRRRSKKGVESLSHLFSDPSPYGAQLGP